MSTDHKETHFELAWNNRVPITLLAGSLALVLNPQFGLALAAGNLLSWGIAAAFAIVTTMLYSFNAKLESTGKAGESKLLSWIHHMTLYGQRYPQLISIIAVTCIISTQAPINIYYSYQVMQALMGNSVSVFEQASFAYLGYINLRFIVHRIALKLQSLFVSGDQAGDLIDIHCHNEMNQRFANQNDISQGDISQSDSTQSDAKKNKPFQDSAKLTMNFWYFIQTCTQAFIAMASSLNAVIRFRVPAAFAVVKQLLMVRTTALAFSFTLLTYVTSAWSTQASKNWSTTKNNIPEEIAKYAGNENSDEIVQPKISFQNALRQTSLWGTIQDGIYDWFKNLNSDNLLTLLIIITTLNPIFPLSGAISVAQIIALGGVLVRMQYDFLAIARNMSALADVKSTYANLEATDTFQQEPKTVINSWYEGQNALSKSNNTSWVLNIVDLSSLILLTLFACGNTFTLPLIGFGVPTWLAAVAAIHVGSSAYNFILKPFSNTPSNGKEKQENGWLRLHILCCNVTTGLLASRLASMFMPASILNSLFFFMASTNAQLLCLGVMTSLLMTTFVTPKLITQENDQNDVLTTLWEVGKYELAPFNILTPASRKSSSNSTDSKAPGLVERFFSNIAGLTNWVPGVAA